MADSIPELTLSNAKKVYWWPQMNGHIRNSVDGCQACARHQRLAPELPWMRPNETYFQSCIDAQDTHALTCTIYTNLYTYMYVHI